MAAFDPEALIAACYAAALDPDLWPAALDGLAAAIDARGMVIVGHDPLRTPHTLHSESLGEVGTAYAAGWWEHDTRIARCKALGMRPGTIAVDGLYLTPEEKRADPFFQDFFARHGLDDLAGFIDRDPRGGTLSISAPRLARHGAYGAAEMARLRLIAPHAARAFKFGLVLGEARQHAADLDRALERMRSGTVLLDRRGCVRSLNGAAERLACGRLSLRVGHPPVALAPDERERLGRLVAAALPEAGAAHAVAALLRGVGAARPVLVETLPLGAAAPLTPGGERGGALLLLQDLLAPPSGSVVPQLRQLGLTAGEARAAMLVGRGGSPREAAEAIGVSVETVRSQLKATYAKLGLRRQSELAIVVTRLDAARDG